MIEKENWNIIVEKGLCPYRVVSPDSDDVGCLLITPGKNRTIFSKGLLKCKKEKCPIMDTILDKLRKELIVEKKIVSELLDELYGAE